MTEVTNNADEPVWTLTRGHLEGSVGRPLTDNEVARVAKCFEYSSIGDVINGVTESCGLWPPDEDEEGDEDYDTGSLAKEDARNAWQHNVG
jgi:hypothetical protein